MRPMLATPGGDRGAPAGPPQGPGWVHEIKWDGIRLVAEVRAGRLRLSTRTEREVTVAFPELAGLAGLAQDLLLDGEVVAMVQGRPSFGRLIERFHTTSARAAARFATTRPVTYLAFDLLRLDGLDLTTVPWQARRDALEQLLTGVAAVQLSPVYVDGPGLFAATAEQGLEGVVSKRVDAPYHPDTRSPDWVKFPHRATASFVVGGWRPETGRARLGALLVGVPAPGGGLLFRGRVGSGLAGRAGAQLAERLARVETGASPFVDEVPAVDAVGATWLVPDVVVEVASLGVTPGQRLRQPAYRGWRPDLTPEDL